MQPGTNKEAGPAADEPRVGAVSSSPPLIHPGEDGGPIVTLSLVDDTDAEACGFWVGLYKTGKLKPPDLWQLGSIEEVFRTASVKGLAEEGPVMVTEASGGESRLIYLLPGPGRGEEVKTVSDLTQTLLSWTPDSLGIYLAPGTARNREDGGLLLQMLTDIIRKTDISHFYLLSGRHGINPLLNTAMMVKEVFEKEKGPEVRIFH